MYKLLDNLKSQEMQKVYCTGQCLLNPFWHFFVAHVWISPRGGFKAGAGTLTLSLLLLMLFLSRGVEYSPVSLAVRAVRESQRFFFLFYFFSTHTSHTPKAPTGHWLSMSIMSETSSAWPAKSKFSLTKFWGRLCNVSALKYADSCPCLKIVQSGSLSTKRSDIRNSLCQQWKVKQFPWVIR